MAHQALLMGVLDPSGAAATWRSVYSKRKGAIITGQSAASEYKNQGNQPKINNAYNYKKQVITGIHGLPFDQQNDDNYWQSKQMLPNIMRPLGSGIRNAAIINEGVYNINPIAGTNNFGGGLVSTASGMNPTNYTLLDSSDLQDRLRANAVPENDPLSAQFALRLPRGQQIDTNNIEGDAQLNTFESQSSILRNAKTQLYNSQMIQSGEYPTYEDSFGYAKKRNGIIQFQDKLRNYSKEDLVNSMLKHGNKMTSMMADAIEEGRNFTEDDYMNSVKAEMGDEEEKDMEDDNDEPNDAEAASEQQGVPSMSQVGGSKSRSRQGLASQTATTPYDQTFISSPPLQIGAKQPRESNLRQNMGLIQNVDSTPLQNNVRKNISSSEALPIGLKVDRVITSSVMNSIGSAIIHSVRNKEGRVGGKVGGSGNITSTAASTILSSKQKGRTTKAQLDINPTTFDDLDKIQRETQSDIDAMSEMGMSSVSDIRKRMYTMATAFMNTNNGAKQDYGKLWMKLYYGSVGMSIQEQIEAYEKLESTFDTPEKRAIYTEEYLTRTRYLESLGQIGERMDTSKDKKFTNVNVRGLEKYSHRPDTIVQPQSTNMDVSDSIDYRTGEEKRNQNVTNSMIDTEGSARAPAIAKLQSDLAKSAAEKAELEKKVAILENDMRRSEEVSTLKLKQQEDLEALRIDKAKSDERHESLKRQLEAADKLSKVSSNLAYEKGKQKGMTEGANNAERMLARLSALSNREAAHTNAGEIDRVVQALQDIVRQNNDQIVMYNQQARQDSGENLRRLTELVESISNQNYTINQNIQNNLFQVFQSSANASHATAIGWQQTMGHLITNSAMNRLGQHISTTTNNIYNTDNRIEDNRIEDNRAVSDQRQIIGGNPPLLLNGLGSASESVQGAEDFASPMGQIANSNTILMEDNVTQQQTLAIEFNQELEEIDAYVKHYSELMGTTPKAFKDSLSTEQYQLFKRTEHSESFRAMLTGFLQGKDKYEVDGNFGAWQAEQLVMMMASTLFSSSGYSNDHLPAMAAVLNSISNFAYGSKAEIYQLPLYGKDQTNPLVSEVRRGGYGSEYVGEFGNKESTKSKRARYLSSVLNTLKGEDGNSIEIIPVEAEVELPNGTKIIDSILIPWNFKSGRTGAIPPTMQTTERNKPPIKKKFQGGGGL
jgi:hypothetical protein